MDGHAGVICAAFLVKGFDSLMHNVAGMPVACNVLLK